MRYLFLILLLTGTVLGDNPYNGIVKRNAFDLTGEKPPAVLPPVHLVLTSVYLTGIARKDKVYTAYMAIKDATTTHLLALKAGEAKHGVEVLKVMKDTVFISHGGTLRELNFRQNSLPSVITKMPTKLNAKDKRGERVERGASANSPQKVAKAPSRALGPQVVTVPSRRPKVDPRLIEKGLEYLSRTEDNEKREYLLKRLESLQSGQILIKSDIDNNERRRQYDEWRKSRERGR